MRCNESEVVSLDNKTEEDEEYFKLLPLEIKEKIWRYLEPASIKKVRMVSKWMKKEIERPQLWSWATLRLTQNNQGEALESELVYLVSGLQAVFSTLIGRGMSILVFHWSRGS